MRANILLSMLWHGRGAAHDASLSPVARSALRLFYGSAPQFGGMAARLCAKKAQKLAQRRGGVAARCADKHWREDGCAQQ